MSPEASVVRAMLAAAPVPTTWSTTWNGLSQGGRQAVVMAQKEGSGRVRACVPGAHIARACGSCECHGGKGGALMP